VILGRKAVVLRPNPVFKNVWLPKWSANASLRFLLFRSIAPQANC